MTPEGKQYSYKLLWQEGRLFLHKHLLGNSCQHISTSNIQPCTRAEDPQGLQASQHKLHYRGTFPAS